MMWLYIILILIIFFPRILKCYQRYYFGEAYKIPCPPGLLLLGNVFDVGFTMEEIFNNFLKLHKKYGSYFGLWLTSFNYRVVISEPKYVDEILSLHLHRGIAYKEFNELFNEGLLNSDVNIWKKNRRPLSYMFHNKLLEDFIEIFNDTSNVFVDIIQKQSSKGCVDIFPLARAFAFDAICKTMTGMNSNVQLNQDTIYVDGIEEYLELFMMKFFSSIKRIKLYYRFTKDYKREQEALKSVKNVTDSIIKKREKERLRNYEKNVLNDKREERRALLDYLLDLKDEGIYTDENVNGHINTFLVAGHHTVSSALSFILFEIAKHQEIQSKILEEVLNVIDNVDANFTMYNLQQLKYTERVVKEGLRMFPTVPFVERTLKEDYKLGDYNLKSGTSALIYIYGIHHDENIYPNPEKFNPDRFLPEEVEKRHPCSYIPFSYGSRNCLGLPFAMCELKLALANIIRRLEIIPVVPEHKPLLFMDAALKTLNGLPINVRVR